MLPPLVPPAGAPPCPTPQHPRRRPPLASARPSGQPAGIGSSSARCADGAPGRSPEPWIWAAPGRQADARVARGSIRRGRLRWQTARLDERAGSGDGDKARAAARGGRTAARRRAPRGFQFACNPLISPDPPKNPFPNISRPKGFVGRCGRRRFRPGSSFPARRVASGGAATARSGHCRATAIAPGVETSSPNRRARLGEGARDEPSAGRMRA